MKNKPLILTVTIVLTAVFLIHHAAPAQTTNDPPPMPQQVAYCDNPPKEKALIGWLALAAVLFLGYAIYKCAKRAVSPPPPPPPPPPTKTNAPPNKSVGPMTLTATSLPWGSQIDRTGFTNSMAGIPPSGTNAFILLYDWPNNQAFVDSDGVPWDSWFCATLPIQTATNLSGSWQNMSMTGYVSAGAVMTLFYEGARPVLTNYVDAVAGEPNIIDLGIEHGTDRQRFYRAVPMH